jgi:hypothetical protein
MKAEDLLKQISGKSGVIPALIETIKDRYRNSLYLTCKDLLGYEDINKDTHLSMISSLQSETRRKLIIMPRGTFKSSIGVVGMCIWLLIRDPNERILIDSEVYTNSKNFLREIKARLSDKKMTTLFGEFKSDLAWTEGEIIISQRTEAHKEASITCGGIETIKVGQHYSTIIMDDCNSQNNSSTPEGCDKVWTHYRMNQAILDPGGRMIVIGTRYAASDLCGKILEIELGIKDAKGWNTNQIRSEAIY